jgi:hypothetical protein
MPDNLIKEWNQWENGLPVDVEVPRLLVAHREPIESIKLHSFGDATKNGVAACVYAVVEQASGTNQGLVAARARLPKKELCSQNQNRHAGFINIYLTDFNTRKKTKKVPNKTKLLTFYIRR